jgi:hypothetical protein
MNELTNIILNGDEEILWKFESWTYTVQNKEQWQAFVRKVTKVYHLSDICLLMYTAV